MGVWREADHITQKKKMGSRTTQYQVSDEKLFGYV